MSDHKFLNLKYCYFKNLKPLRYWSTEEERISKFAERVQQWEEKMIPLLEEEQTHPEFDVHYYGDKLVEKFSNGVGSVQDFAQVFIFLNFYINLLDC